MPRRCYCRLKSVNANLLDPGAVHVPTPSGGESRTGAPPRRRVLLRLRVARPRPLHGRWGPRLPRRSTGPQRGHASDGSSCGPDNRPLGLLRCHQGEGDVVIDAPMPQLHTPDVLGEETRFCSASHASPTRSGSSTVSPIKNLKPTGTLISAATYSRKCRRLQCEWTSNARPSPDSRTTVTVKRRITDIGAPRGPASH